MTLLIRQICLFFVFLFLIINNLNAQNGKNKIFTLDIVTTPGMVFIPLHSNLPNYLISIGGKSELLGINIEWLKSGNSMNESVVNSYFTLGTSVRAFGLNWRKSPLNHAVSNDINAKDIVYASFLLGGKFICDAV